MLLRRALGPRVTVLTLSVLALAGAADGAPTSAPSAGAVGPFVRLEKLLGKPRYLVNFGAAVAVSRDGQEVAVGAPRDTSTKGAVYVFTRRGGAWSSVKLTGGDGFFGSSVSLSSDGNTLLVGAPYAGDDDFGAAWVFTHSGGAWVGQKLKVYGADGNPGFGYSVALSGTGKVALVGGPYDNRRALRRPYTRKFGKGAAWLFRRSGSTWRQSYNKLTAAVGHDAGFGAAVDLDFDGNRAIVGAPKHADWTGRAFVVERDAGGGLRQTRVVGYDRKKRGFGSAVAIEGRYAVVGEARQDYFDTGDADIFERRDDGTWPSTASIGPGKNHSHFGAALAFAAPPGDEPVLAVGAYRHDSGTGAAWVYGLASPSPEEHKWVQVQQFTAGARPGTKVLLGQSVALSQDGQTAVVGAPGEAGDRGTALVYGTAPTVDEVVPASGPEGGGTRVRITGSRFVGVSAVTFGSRPAQSFRVESPTAITAVSPPGDPGTVDVSVALRRGTGSSPGSAARFTYLARPAVTSIEPDVGPTGGGTAVTIRGSGFDDVTAVRFGSTPAASFRVDSPAQIRAVTPPGSVGTVDVTVTAATGTSPPLSAGRFTYVVPADVITFDDLVTGGPGGGGGTPVTVSSQYAGRRITFNDVSAIDYAKGTFAIAGFAHSGTVAVESCVGVEFCTKPIRASFSSPQRTVCAWVGFSFRLGQPVLVQLRALSGGAVVGAASATLPANPAPTPIRTQLLVIAGAPSITQLEVSIPGGYDNGLAVDDVTFSADRALESCSP